MALILSAKVFPFSSCKTLKRSSHPGNVCHKMRSRCICCISSQVGWSSRRNAIVWSVSFATILALNCVVAPLQLEAEEKASEQDENDEGVLSTIKSLFDPDEKTKSGKLLPKGYLKSAREVVKTLRESLKENPKDMAKFRRTADAAKESIREYLSSWKGQEKVVGEESYIELEKAFRSLAKFYSRAGPSAPISEEAKSEILSELNRAEEFL